jgi:hypothetical protein
MFILVYLLTNQLIFKWLIDENNDSPPLIMENHVSVFRISLKALFPVGIPVSKQCHFMQFLKLQNDNSPFLSCALMTLCMAPDSVLRSMAHSSVTSHSSPDPSPSPSVSTFSCKTKCQTTRDTIYMRPINPPLC